MAKSILIRATIEGCGIVNFDAKEQRFLWNKQKGVEKCHHENTTFGKGRYYQRQDDEGKEYLVKVPVISADCIRHTMFEDNMFIHLPNIMHDDQYLLRAVSHPSFLERGYLFARDGKTIWKRKSPFALTYARGVEYSQAALETYSNSQPKTGENKSEEASETSFFKREVRGDTKYELTGFIDLIELGFISVSDVHDRLSFDSDYAETFRDLIKDHLGEVSEPQFYSKNGDVYDIPEYGILLSEDQVKYLANDVLKRLAKFNLFRSTTGFAKTTKVEIKIVNDPLEDLAGESDGWVTIFDGNVYNSAALDNAEITFGYTEVDVHEEALEKIEAYRKKFGYVKESKSTKAKATKK
jgi:hypothetical protein